MWIGNEPTTILSFISEIGSMHIPTLIWKYRCGQTTKTNDFDSDCSFYNNRVLLQLYFYGLFNIHFPLFRRPFTLFQQPVNLPPRIQNWKRIRGICMFVVFSVLRWNFYVIINCLIVLVIIYNKKAIR